MGCMKKSKKLNICNNLIGTIADDVEHDVEHLTSRFMTSPNFGAVLDRQAGAVFSVVKSWDKAQVIKTSGKTRTAYKTMSEGHRITIVATRNTKREAEEWKTMGHKKQKNGTNEAKQEPKVEFKEAKNEAKKEVKNEAKNEVRKEAKNEVKNEVKNEAEEDKKTTSWADMVEADEKEEEEKSESASIPAHAALAAPVEREPEEELVPSETYNYKYYGPLAYETLPRMEAKEMRSVLKCLWDGLEILRPYTIQTSESIEVATLTRAAKIGNYNCTIPFQAFRYYWGFTDMFYDYQKSCFGIQGPRRPQQREAMYFATSSNIISEFDLVHTPTAWFTKPQNRTIPKK